MLARPFARPLALAAATLYVTAMIGLVGGIGVMAAGGTLGESPVVERSEATADATIHEALAGIARTDARRRHHHPGKDHGEGAHGESVGASALHLPHAGHNDVKMPENPFPDLHRRRNRGIATA